MKEIQIPEKIQTKLQQFDEKINTYIQEQVTRVGQERERFTQNLIAGYLANYDDVTDDHKVVVEEDKILVYTAEEFEELNNKAEDKTEDSNEATEIGDDTEPQADIQQ